MSAPTQSYILDGTGDYISLADHGDFDATTYVSMGMWICRDWDDTNDVVLLDRASSYEFGIKNDMLYFTIEGAGTVYSGRKVPRNRPVFLAGVAYESGSDLYLEAYISDTQVATETILSATLPAANANALYIGADATPGSSPLKGTISSIFMTDDRVRHDEIRTVFASSSGQATGVLSDLVIDIDTEGDLVNAGSAGDGTGVGNAAARTYMNLFQSMKTGHTIHVPEAETRYETPFKINPISLRWYGDLIADGDTVQLTDINDTVVFTHIATVADEGGVWYFDDEEIWSGLIIKTLGHGILELSVR